jgi:flagellar assembly factor FliW
MNRATKPRAKEPVALVLATWKIKNVNQLHNSGRLSIATKASLNLLSVLVVNSEIKITKNWIAPIMIKGKGHLTISTH